MQLLMKVDLRKTKFINEVSCKSTWCEIADTISLFCIINYCLKLLTKVPQRLMLKFF